MKTFGEIINEVEVKHNKLFIHNHLIKEICKRVHEQAVDLCVEHAIAYGNCEWGLNVIKIIKDGLNSKS